jgi:pimeloyl-ACP methyl ester carboxylesterase
MKREVRGREVGFDDRGSGPAVVLLHPYPFDRLIWAGVADGLARRHRVIAVDARGFGESALDAPYAIADLADDVAGLLEELGVARATVLGMSMGGYTALAFAARHARRLEGLVLADTRALPDSPDGRKGRDAQIALYRQPGGAARVADGFPRLLRPSAPPALLAHLRARAETRPASLVAALEAMRDRPDRTGELAAIRCRTLVICGADEQVAPPAEMRAMAEAIPGARFVLLAEAGHLSHLEAPGAFEAAVSSFLAGGAPSSEGGRP